MTALNSATYKPGYNYENDNSQASKGSQNSENESFFGFLNIFSSKNNNNKSSFGLLDETVAAIKKPVENVYTRAPQNDQDYLNNLVASLSPEERAALSEMFGGNSKPPGQAQQNPIRPAQPATIQPNQQNIQTPNQPAPRTIELTGFIPRYDSNGNVIGWYRPEAQNNPAPPNQPLPAPVKPAQQNPIKPVQPATITSAQTNPVPTISNAPPKNGKNYNTEETIGTAGDGRIGDFSQTINGDCWFLSTLKSVANDPQGERLLLNSIKKTNAGWVVTFPGASERSFTVTQAELDQAKVWIPDPQDNNKGGYRKALGDDDVTILEIAAEKYFGGNLKGAEGRQEPEAYKLLTGQNAMDSESVGGFEVSVNTAYNNCFLSLSQQDQNNISKNISSLMELYNNSDQIQDNINNQQALINARVAQYEAEYQNKLQSTSNSFEKTLLKQERSAFIAQVNQEINSLNKRMDEVNYAVKNRKAIKAYKARQDAIQMFKNLQSDSDQVSLTAGGRHDINKADSGHSYSVKFDRTTGNYLVSDPHNTNEAPEVYSNSEALMNRFYRFTDINDIR